ncbi:hypothetical protein QTP70_004249 [Hemibagrus guttatus]|uniref:Uncharacterized protein n=1 Tax=Hemibagrus guttatus TaxID=175788 RepID=A0AAE0PV11_9TELE|nr:hypothetical protein QTP70_004249 [Hemibagrus guttatus]
MSRKDRLYSVLVSGRFFHHRASTVLWYVGPVLGGFTVKEEGKKAERVERNPHRRMGAMSGADTAATKLLNLTQRFQALRLKTWAAGGASLAGSTMDQWNCAA